MGKVTLVGAGPYDQGLITVKGLRAIRTADCILYDRLLNPALLAEAPPHCEKIAVGKMSSAHTLPQEEMNRLLLQKATQYRHTVRLKGGDPFVFGRGGEELTLLVAEGIPYEIVPGVTSAVAAPAYAGIPVTHRDHASSLHIITGHARGDKPLAINYTALAALDQMGGTLVFLMGLENLPAIQAGLLAAGVPQSRPVALVENGTSPRQRSFGGRLDALTQLAKANGVTSPTVIVVGEVAALGDTFAWRQHTPLASIRVLAACHADSAPKLAHLLAARGCDVLPYPCATVGPVPFILPALAAFDYITFSSKQGVRFFMEGLYATGKDVRALAHLKIAVVGAETAAELKTFGLCADYMPPRFTAADLAAGLAASCPPGTKLLLVGPARPPAEDTFYTALGQSGFVPTLLPVYETRQWPADPIPHTDWDYITFTSASTVKGFAAANADKLPVLAAIPTVCIGPQTTAAAQKAGFAHIHTAQTSTFDGIADCIEEMTAHAQRAK